MPINSEMYLRVNLSR